MPTTRLSRIWAHLRERSRLYAVSVGAVPGILRHDEIHSPVPVEVRDGRASLLSFAAAGALLALLIWLSVGGRSDGKSIRGGENDRGYIRSLAQS